MTPVFLRELLSNRGCRLNGPASDSGIASMRAVIGNTPNWTVFEGLYRCFDGFSGIDPKSMVRLWPIEQILSFSPDYKSDPDKVAFSDIQFDAEIAHLSRSDDPGIYGISGNIVAKSLSDIVQKIVDDTIEIA